jgi:hypothetical protein
VVAAWAAGDHLWSTARRPALRGDRQKVDSRSNEA